MRKLRMSVNSCNASYYSVQDRILVFLVLQHETMIETLHRIGVDKNTAEPSVGYGKAVEPLK
jgi:hypothetical protein